MLAGGRFGTNDFEKARRFYDAIAELLGAKRVIDRPDLVAYRSERGGVLVIGAPLAGEASPGNGNQLSLEAETRGIVDAVHARALELGGSCAGAPGIRGADINGFYGAYFRDPEGNKMVIYRVGPP